MSAPEQSCEPCFVECYRAQSASSLSLRASVTAKDVLPSVVEEATTAAISSFSVQVKSGLSDPRPLIRR